MHMMEGPQLGTHLTGEEKAVAWANTVSSAASVGSGAPGTVRAVSADFTALSTAEHVAGETAQVMVNPAELRWTQRTAGGNGRADVLRQSMAENGYAGPPIDVVQTPDGLATVDHTRPAVALEQGIQSIPANVHLPNEPLPASMAGRFG